MAEELMNDQSRVGSPEAEQLLAEDEKNKGLKLKKGWLAVGFMIMIVVFVGILMIFKQRQAALKKVVPPPEPDIRPTEVIKKEDKQTDKVSLPPEEKQLLQETDVNLNDIDSDLKQIETDLNRL
ncbi:MAG: hypothetical protein GXP43_00080 [bacterium]|nr:hypothetical protein [bacterium]